MTHVTATELAWLAGFWDADGSITMFSHQEKNGQKKISPIIAAYNTHEATAAHICELTDRMGCSLHLFKRERQKPNHADAYQLTTRRIDYIATLLEAMLPYLVTKKAQAQLVLRYVRKKAEQRRTHGRPRYDEEDRTTQLQVQALNKNGPKSKPSETKGEAPTGDDIVRPHAKS